MSSFFSLLYKEWLQFRIYIICTLVLCYGFSLSIPKIIETTFPTEVVLQELILVFSIFGIIVIFIAFCYQFIRSLILDVRQKELWLHNPASMYKLIGVKMVFSALSIVMVLLLYTVQYHFLTPVITETLKIVNMQFLIAFIVMIMFVELLVLFLLAYTFHLIMQRHIKGFAIVTTILFVIVVIKILDEITMLSLFEVLPVSYSSIEKGLPIIYSQNLYMEGDENFYFGSEIFIWCVTIIGFILGCKWIEKVITR